MDYLYRSERIAKSGKSYWRTRFVMEASVRRAARFMAVLVSHLGFGHRVKVGKF